MKNEIRYYNFATVSEKTGLHYDTFIFVVAVVTPHGL